MKYSTLVLSLLISVVGWSSNLYAQVTNNPPETEQEQSDNWDKEWDKSWDDEFEEVNESPWVASGFTELAAGGFTQSNVTEKQLSLAELRARLDLDYKGETFNAELKTDVFYDEVIEQAKFKLREANISFSAADNIDVTLGRQIITWGTGDYLFLNDLFAKDWQSFFSGRDDTYLKAANDSARVIYYLDSLFSLKNVTFDFVYTPDFTPDNYLNGERFSFYSPMSGSVTAHSQIAPEHFPVETTNNEEYALRIAGNINSVEYALYGYKGYWSTPVGSKLNTQTAYFPKLTSYGASVSMPLAQGIFNAEFASYQSGEDTNGDKANIANSQVRVLVGYEQELAKNLTGAMQFYVEHTKDHGNLLLSAPKPEQASIQMDQQNRQVITIRLTNLAKQQKLTSSLFMFYSPTENDAYIKPSMSYRYSDNWQFSGGANVFLGKDDYTFFGQHKDNSNMWLRARYLY